MEAKALERLAWDFLRHDLDLRELRILFAILFRTGKDGKARLERKFFEKRLGIRDDHARVLCRGLERARVLCVGWEQEEFVLQRNCDLWRRDELAGRDEQFVLPLEGQDAGVLFAQAVATAESNPTAGFSPTVGEPHGGLAGARTVNPQVGDGHDGSGLRCECPNPRTFPEDLSEQWRESLRSIRTCFFCAIKRGLVRTLVRSDNSEKVQQRTKGPGGRELEVMLARKEWQERLAGLSGGGDEFRAEVRGQLARGYKPRLLEGWLMAVLRKYEKNQRKEIM